MDRRSWHTLAALVAGGGTAGGLGWLVGHVVLALATGLCWACGLALTLRIGRLYPGYATGETWDDKRWTGLSVGVVTLAALIGVSPALPLSNELRLGLGYLVLGAGLAAYAAGTLAVLERVETDADVVPADSPAGYSPDGD